MTELVIPSRASIISALLACDAAIFWEKLPSIARTGWYQMLDRYITGYRIDWEYDRLIYWLSEENPTCLPLPTRKL